MGLTKSDIYTSQQNHVAIILKALAHPARIAILEHLIKVNSCICGDILDVVSLSQPTISQHLKELKNAGIIQGKIEGTSVCYCLNTDTLEFIKNYFTNTYLLSLNQKNNCCN
jgi:DNA-binding transcriptional ArsR family regulator